MLEWLFGKKKQQTKPEVPKEKGKKKLTQSQQETEDKWQYEFLVQFLNSPLWRVSILDFVDHNCVVFDNQQENKFEYTKIHNQFKELVGNLFDGMMNQIGLDDEKLVLLLQKGFESKQKKLFNQLLLCDDFLKFKELMVKRNKALEAEAMKALNGQQRKVSVLDKQRNLVHSSIKLQEERKRKIQQQEEQILRKVLQMSRLQVQEKQSIQKLAQQVDKKQPKKSSQLNKKQNSQAQIVTDAFNQQKQEPITPEERKNLKTSKTKKLESIQNTDKKKLPDLPPLKAPIEKPKLTQKLESKPEQVNEIKEDVKQQPKVQSNEERKKRLLEQRQKIRKKKEEERKKLLDEEEMSNKKVMNIVLQDQGIHDSVHPRLQHQNEQKISKDEIERRKEIMKKIKNRIVDDF